MLDYATIGIEKNVNTKKSRKKINALFSLEYSISLGENTN
jgi:hypothetical protein